MIPSIFVPIRKLPVTVSGKVDRRRLRESVRQYSRAELNALTMAAPEFRSPQSEAEHVVRRLTAQILGLPSEQVGMNHCFLRLGGDSVGAMKMAGLARRERLSLKVADILGLPTLADLAQAITPSASCTDPEPFQLVVGFSEKREQLLLAASAQCGVPISDIEDMYPCTPFQEGLMGLSSVRLGAGVAHFSHDPQPCQCRAAQSCLGSGGWSEPYSPDKNHPECVRGVTLNCPSPKSL